jgi:flagellar biosynthesis/type III secretory pathway chaperone
VIGMTAPDELLRALAAERAALAALVAVLEREQALLAAGEAEPIEEIAREKERAVHCAEALGTARARLAARPDPAQGEAAGEAWRALLGEARRARSLNEANGRLIAVQAGFVHARLASLAGAAAGAGYGPAGPIAPPSPTRVFGAA